MVSVLAYFLRTQLVIVCWNPRTNTETADTLHILFAFVMSWPRSPCPLVHTVHFPLLLIDCCTVVCKFVFEKHLHTEFCKNTSWMSADLNIPMNSISFFSSHHPILSLIKKSLKQMFGLIFLKWIFILHTKSVCVCFLLRAWEAASV